MSDQVGRSFLVRRFRAAACAAALLALGAASAVPARAASTSTIFTTQVATNAAAVSKPIEVGVKFQSDSSGTVTGVRFFKLSSANSGTHIGDLWSSSGQLLASATFTGETASGWQTVLFSTPVAILANTTYIASYHTTTQYSVTRNYFTSAGADNAPLHAPQSTAAAPNGVYAYGTGPTFPNNGVSDSNWWADVLFQAGAPQPPPPPPGCAVSAGQWLNFPIAAQPGTFQARFDAVPLQGSMDGVAGVAAAAASDFTQLATTVRFSTNGFIDARDGAAYHASSPVPYIVNSTHTFRFEVNVPAKRYNAFVSVNGSAEQLIASNFAFRTEQAGVSSLSDLGAQADAGSERVCAPVISAWTPTASSWTAVASMPEAHNDFAMSLLASGKALVVGGSVFDPQYTSAVYDPLSNAWFSTGLLNDPREHATATLLPDGKVLVAGGSGGEEPLQTAELFNPATNKFTRTGAMNAPRINHSAVLLPSGKVLLAGGGLATAELYDPASGTWSNTGSMSAVRGRFTLTLLPSGKVLAAGGFSASSPALASAEVYDPASGTWTATGSMGTARSEHAAVLLDDGRVLVAGGSASVSSASPLTSAEIYDPASGQWTAVSPMAAARAYPVAALRGDGTVLVAGGSGGTDATASLASAELFNPATGAWTNAGPMTTQRVFFGAARLNDGRVLVAGGQNAVGAALASAEVYAAAPAVDHSSGTVASSTTTIFTTQAPTTAASASQPIEVGVKFRSDSDGAVIGVRFYKFSSANSGTHTGDLWSASGQLLASAAFTGETASGWQTVLFSNPVAVQANTVYVASYHTTTQYSVTRNYFTNAGVDNAPLHALKTGVSGVNGAYAYGAGPTFPVNGVSDSNWWADVIFKSTGSAAPPPPQPPSITSVSPTSAVAGSGGFTLSVFGQDFSTSSLVQWNGSSRPTTFGSASSLTATIFASDVQSPGGFPVRVLDPGGASNAVQFSVVGSTPSAQWTQTGALASAHYGQPLARLLDGRVFLPGGNGESQSLSEIYDPGSDTWSVAGSAQPWTSRSATTLLDGRVLLAGGRGQECCVADSQLFNPGTTTYAVTGSLNQARGADSVTLLLDGRVLAAGGQTDTENKLASAEIYDPATGTWSLTGSMAAMRFGHAAVRLPDGRVLVAGGGNGLSQPTATVEIYDPTKGTWSAAKSMSTPRAGPIGVLLKDGRVLVAGGGPASAEIFDPATGNWTSTGSMASSEHGAATLLADGSVLAEGGGTNTAERYDPVTGTWSSAGMMHSVMTGQGAVLLKSGRVLVVDGAIDGVIRRPELYDPGPFVAALSPSTATAGGPSFSLSVTGLLFSTSSVVRWNGAARATTFVSASTLTAAIPSSDIAAGGSAQVSVADPLGASNALQFTVGAAAPPSTATTIVSLTFDDSTAGHTVAQQVLDAHGVKGTFYVISGRVGAAGNLTLAQVRGLADDGHEVAGHTVNHYDLTTLVSSEVVHQICDDKTQLETWGFKPFNFAYPFGAANPDVEAVAKNCGYTSARGVGGLTCSGCAPAEKIPPANAYYVATPESIKGTTTLEQIESYVTSAEQAGGGWVPLVMHVITDDPNETYSISSTTLSAFLDWLNARKSSGTVVKTIGEVMGTPVVAPAPYLSSLSPEAAQAGGPGFTLNAFGLGFSTASVVRWNGAARQTTFVSSSTLAAAIPASDLSAGGTVQVTVAGPNGVSDAQPFTVFAAAGFGSTTTIFSTLIATNAATASKPIEVGVKFRSDTAGNAVGVRFYKLSATNSGTHIGDLWSEAGTLLASATFTAETPSGWQTVLFSTPVAIVPNTTYVASYHTTTMYSVTRNYFTSAGVDNPPLHALKTGVAGVNGVYAYGAGPTFPTNGVSDSNWWADVIFQPAQSGSPMSAMGLSAASFAAAASTATAAEESFGFRDLYVFPNPSRRGRSMTIRLQAGMADTAELKIYDLSGRLIRETPFGAPKVLDDGNGKGPQFTYDYQWDVGGVGSGVYIFRVTARKSGEPEIEKIGKGAIIK